MLKNIALLPIRFYARFISPLIPQTCRFQPTCSAYGLQAIQKHGAFKGGVLAIWRILRCNPWHRCAYHDPVPERFEWRAMIGYKRQSSKK